MNKKNLVWIRTMLFLIVLAELTYTISLYPAVVIGVDLLIPLDPVSSVASMLVGIYLIMLVALYVCGIWLILKIGGLDLMAVIYAAVRKKKQKLNKNAFMKWRKELHKG